MQHSDQNTCNIRLEQMKHFEQTYKTFAICLWNTYNICNPPIYFCNIHIKQLQHTSETSKTLETCACNMRFHHIISLLRSHIAVAMASAAATTFWWVTMALAAPRHVQGMGHGAQQRAARHIASWSRHSGGWSVTLDGGRDREDGSLERTPQSSTRWARAIGRYFWEKSRETQRVSITFFSDGVDWKQEHCSSTFYLSSHQYILEKILVPAFQNKSSTHI